MIPSFARCASSFVLICALLSISTAAAPSKPIRLQNETIQPDAAGGVPASTRAAEDVPANALALIQFTDSPRPEWRAQLAAMGVNLLCYVPDDTFVADLKGVPPARIRQLDFIAWIGHYRPEHKLHRALRTIGPNAATNTTAQTAEDVLAVTILMSPHAPAVEAQSARGLLERVEGESPLRAGTVLTGRISRARLSALAESRVVLWVEPAPKLKLFDEVASRIVAGDGPPHQTQMQSLGYNGAGVTVAVADSGLDSGDTNSMHPDIQGRVRALFYYGAPGQLDKFFLDRLDPRVLKKHDIFIRNGYFDPRQNSTG